MNPEAQDRLEKILKKDLSELAPEDLNFLRARRSYLTPAQFGRYNELLTETKPSQEDGKKDAKVTRKTK